MSTRRLILACFLAACSSTPNPPPDPCAVLPPVDGGTAEVGAGTMFTPILAGQDLQVELGIQGLYMFVLNARVKDMDVGLGDLSGVIEYTVKDQGGQLISLTVGCRQREFEDTPDGFQQLTSAYLMPLLPTATNGLAGSTVTLHVEVRDHDGRRATDERAVVARMPPSGP